MEDRLPLSARLTDLAFTEFFCDDQESNVRIMV